MTPDEANAAAALQPGETVDARVARLFAGMRDGTLAATGLTRLDLSGCAIERLPDEIATCASLEFLSLGKNPLRSLPETFSGLVNLRVLFFLGCDFTEVPAVIGRLPRLYMLSVKANKLERVPEGAVPKSVCWLILSDNRLAALPRCVGECVGMRKLLLAGNRLTNAGLPDTMRNLCDLELVRLADNRLEKIPEWLLRHPKLASLALAANPCTEPFAAAARRRCDDTRSADDAFDVPEVSWASLDVDPAATPLGKGASGEVFASRRGGVDGGVAAVKVYAHAAKTSDGRPADEMAASVLASRTGCASITRTLARFTKDADECQTSTGLVMEFLDPAVWKNLGSPPARLGHTRRLRRRRDAELRGDRGVGAVRRRRGARCAAGVHHGDLYAHNVLFERIRKDPPRSSRISVRFFYPPGSALGAELEKIETRAFGVLLEEALARHDGEADEHDGVRVAELEALAARCVGEREGRPTFAEIVAEVGEERQHI